MNLNKRSIFTNSPWQESSNYVGESNMINIKCKKCGWTLPFTARAKKDNVCGRKPDDVECPKCGKLLIRKGGNVNRWY